VTEGLRIVIVEDDALIAMDLADLLIGMGHDVRAIAGTEAEAVAAAIRCKPNLMIVDGNLAEGSGVSAMHRILARDFVAHLYVTGDTAQIQRAAPDAVVVTKPFSMRGLSNGIAAALRAPTERPCPKGK
jgi:DNA-binding response OmpR family regulator